LLKRKILIRVDASSEMGYGHFMRMISLGQLLTDSGYEVHFATTSKVELIDRLLCKESFIIHPIGSGTFWNSSKDLNELLRIAAQINPVWVVIDGYQFKTSYERVIKENGYLILRINDFSSEHCVADILLDQNFGAPDIKHSVEPYTVVLAGLKYLLIRREFREIHIEKKPVLKSDNIHILVSLGGGVEICEPLILKIVKGLSKINRADWEASVITGSMKNKAKKEIFELAQKSTLHINIIEQTMNMAIEMSAADLAIVSAGSVMWESMFMKVPFLAISLTRMQADYLRLLAGKGLCDNLGWHKKLTINELSKRVIALAEDKLLRKNILLLADREINRENYGVQLLKLLNRES
jgi:UDP-2,4-diacetamido-2,4,6-trideoxy-beta-L-altropyranose hydrolase